MPNIPKPSRLTLQCSLVALITVLLMSWLRPLGVLFVGLLTYWLYWTRCSFRIVLTPELQEKIEIWLHKVAELRRASPGMFCLVSSGCLGTLSILGHLISGSTLVLALLVISALLSTKYNFKLIKIEHKDFNFCDKINYNNTEPEVDDEFLPDVNESNLFVLERASDVATISSPTDDEEHSDDVPSELLIPDIIPEIDEHSTDEDNELVPQARKQNQSAHTVAATKSKSEAKAIATTTSTKSSTDPIEFRKGHFKRDSSLSSSSSSSEESLSKGLQFPDHTSIDAPDSKLSQLPAGAAPSQSNEASNILALAFKTQTQSLLANSGSLLPTLASGLAQLGDALTNASNNTAVTAQKQQQEQQQVQQRVVSAMDSSDESDFEILERDECN